MAVAAVVAAAAVAMVSHRLGCDVVEELEHHGAFGPLPRALDLHLQEHLRVGWVPRVVPVVVVVVAAAAGGVAVVGDPRAKEGRNQMGRRETEGE